MREKNHGVIERRPRPKDWRAGGITGITRSEVLRADGQWDSYLPVFEKQYNPYFDTMACVSYGNVNCPETLMFRQYGKKVNYSDRFIAKMSGTTHDGNDEYTVAETIRNCGLVDEEVWPFGPWVKDWDTYYSDIPQEVKDDGLTFLKEYKLNYHYVDEQNQDELIGALKYSPLAIFVPGHCMTLYGYELGAKWKVYDTYGDGFKEYPWDYKFRCAIEWQLNKINPNMSDALKLADNTLVQLVEGTGGFGLYLNGKLYIDDLAKILASWSVRNDGDTKGKVVAVKMKDWNAFKHFNLKNEAIN